MANDRDQPDRDDGYDRWMWAAAEEPYPDPAAREWTRQVRMADERDEELDDEWH